MIPSLLKIWLLCLGSIFLTSCIATSNWLSGPSQQQNSQFDTSPHVPPLQIGVTTKQETVSRFGEPTNTQIHSIDGIEFESLSYSTTERAISPFQYLPLFGAVAFWGPLADQTPSAAISFSSEDQVSGLTISTINAYGDIRSPEIISIEDSPASFYGMRNPDVFHTLSNSTGSSP